MVNKGENLAAILYDAKDLRLEPVPIPEIADDEVLLRMDTVGICGSDVHYWDSGTCGPYVVTAPMIMGHEASGVVEKIGAKVRNLKPGDRVAIEPGVPCRYCEFCKTGRYHLCPDILFCATPPVHGNLCRYYKHAADFCFKLPDHVTMEEGALLEPLSVGIHALRRSNVSAGDTVLVLGAGPIGQVTMLAARAMGAKVMITDSREFLLTHAKQNGADLVLLLRRDEDESEQVKKIHQLLGKAPDVCIYASGGLGAMRVSLLATKNGGTSALVGFPSSEVPLPVAETVGGREVTIKGVFRYSNEYPIALELVASGKVDLKPLVTHHYSLEQTLEAFELARRGVGIKILIHVQPRDQNNFKKFEN